MEDPKNTPDPDQAINRAKKDLELAYYHLKEALNFPNEPLKQVLVDDLIAVIEQFKTDLLNKSEPKDIFKRAFEAMNIIDKKVFVLDYVFDYASKVYSIPRVLQYFEELGLLDLRDHKKYVVSGDIRHPEDVIGWGNFLFFIKSCYRKIGIIAIKLISSSLKSIPELAQFEHKITFGKKGLFPEISFSTGSNIELTLETVLDEVGDTLWFQDLTLQKTLAGSETKQ